jgi:hypothetical protein
LEKIPDGAQATVIDANAIAASAHASTVRSRFAVSPLPARRASIGCAR